MRSCAAADDALARSMFLAPRVLAHGDQIGQRDGD